MFRRREYNLFFFFLGPESWHVPLSEVSWFAWLSSFLPLEATFADVFIYGLVFFFLATQLPVR